MLRYALARTTLTRIEKLADAIEPIHAACVRAGVLSGGNDWLMFRGAALSRLERDGAMLAAIRLRAMESIGDRFQAARLPAPVPELDPVGRCGMGIAEIRERASRTATCGADAYYAGSYGVDGAIWRVWRCEPRHPKWIYVPHVLVRRADDGSVRVEVEHFSSAEPISADRIGREIAIWEAHLRRAAICESYRS